MGATDPKNADENTIRKLYGIPIDKNSVHGPDSAENAKKEINCFFLRTNPKKFYKSLRISKVLKILSSLSLNPTH